MGRAKSGAPLIKTLYAMNENNYTIDKVGWHTMTEGNPESIESIHARFRTICSFLNDNSFLNNKWGQSTIVSNIVKVGIAL